MSLQCKVMYLEPSQVNKLKDVRERFGLKDLSEANRLLIDIADFEILDKSGEFKVWENILHDAVQEANRAVDRAEASLDRAIAYFATLN